MLNQPLIFFCLKLKKKNELEIQITVHEKLKCLFLIFQFKLSRKLWSDCENKLGIFLNILCKYHWIKVLSNVSSLHNEF